MKKTIWLVFFGFFLIFLTSCIVSEPKMAPPPPKTEIIPVAPQASYLWVSGHWKWSAGRYIWVPGYWARPHPGYVWVPGHWEKRGRHWLWRPGRWRRI
jgi:hypothetical protein